jgi:hypothetical protein
MKAVEHSNPSEVVISIPSDFDHCPACSELRFFVGAQAVCGCNADPSGPAVGAARPHSPEPLEDLEAVAVAA